MKERFFGHGTTISVLGSPDHSRAAKCGKENAGERKGKGGFNGTGRAFFGEKQAQDPELRSEEDCAWWSQGNRGKKGFLKGHEGFRKGGFRTSPSEKGSSSDFYQHTDKDKDQKRKRQGETPLKRDLVLCGNKAIGTPIVLTIPQRVRGIMQDIQLIWRQFPWILPTIRRTLF